MEFLLDDPEADKLFHQIVRSLPSMQNGITADSMEKRGVHYEKNWGISLVDLRSFAQRIPKNHVLALKLWNKKWRETKILATLLDEPEQISEEQMDYWIKTAETLELTEQIVFNLFAVSRFAFVKALEWCRGKKFNVKAAGLLMMGQLSIRSKNDIDEMFEAFFDVLPPLAKDPSLSLVFFRSYCQLARRSKNLYQKCLQFAGELIAFPEDSARVLGNELIDELGHDEFQNLIRK
ncbi:MAG TPA: DNA alkylation repair protein [Prolixibacteraceae bacterium]|nr:DNA alkylation repair protein [Prolixibacteraceae bacterium]